MSNYPSINYSPFNDISVLEKEGSKFSLSKENVISPTHYQILPNVETIDVIKATLTKEEFIGYCKGNILKYVTRAKLKNKEEDLLKAARYSSYMEEALKK